MFHLFHHLRKEGDEHTSPGLGQSLRRFGETPL
nr:MAG TPA: hypothetical protein [Caudoviricetes sp.]